MKAIYYAIKAKANHQILDEGILTDVYSIIYPAQYLNVEGEKLPFECEVRYFKSENFYIEIYDFEIDTKNISKFIKPKQGYLPQTNK